MTAIDHTEIHSIDLRGLEAESGRPRAPKSDDAELHLLRLALDLQVDAMLLALGAAAREGDDGVPWQRWLVEDLAVARTLTSTLLIADVEPMPALGGVSSGASRNALDNLVARYESMDELLTSVLRRPHSGQRWRPAATEALARCRTRLEELHAHRAAAHRQAATRPVSAVRGVTSAAANPRSRTFLPGELLG